MATASSRRGEDPAAQIVTLVLIDAPFDTFGAFVAEPGQLLESWLSLVGVKKMQPWLKRRFAQAPSTGATWRVLAVPDLVLAAPMWFCRASLSNKAVSK